MDNNTPVKRGRGRPKKWTEDNPKPKRDEKNPLEVIRKPSRDTTAAPVEIEGDNAKYTNFAMAIMMMPKIDVRDPQQLRTRVAEYFQLCADHDMKPGVAAVGLAVGLDRRRLWEIRSGIENRNSSIPQECKDIIISVYDSLEVLWEGYMSSGKINPVSGIFLAKNNFGYQDKQEYVVTPNQMSQNTDPRVLEAKYDELPED